MPNVALKPRGPLRRLQALGYISISIFFWQLKKKWKDK
jgi:hypothetical protein